MITQLHNRLIQSNYGSILLSIPATLLWIGVGGFLLRWHRAWIAGNLEPGLETSWTALYVIFGISALAMMAGFCLTITAWIGRSTVRWQIASAVLGLVFLWVVAGD